MSPQLILASTSPRRRDLLQQIGLDFDVVAPDYEERFNPAVDPEQLAMELALGKAGAVAVAHPDAVVLGADTFISFQGRQLGKPETPERAKEMLQMLSGTKHQVATGFAVMGSGRPAHVEAVISNVFMRSLEENEIDAYIATGEPLDCAGSYNLQKRGATFIERIEGDSTAIIGLPVSPVVLALRGFGIMTE